MHYWSVRRGARSAYAKSLTLPPNVTAVHVDNFVGRARRDRNACANLSRPEGYTSVYGTVRLRPRLADTAVSPLEIGHNYSTTTHSS